MSLTSYRAAPPRVTDATSAKTDRPCGERSNFAGRPTLHRTAGGAVSDERGYNRFAAPVNPLAHAFSPIDDNFLTVPAAQRAGGSATAAGDSSVARWRQMKKTLRA